MCYTEGYLIEKNKNCLIFTMTFQGQEVGEQMVIPLKSVKKLEKHKEAIDCYSKLNNVKSSSTKFYRNIAQLNIVSGKPKEAIKFYNLAIEHEPKDLSNYYHLSTLDNNILNNSLKKYINEVIQSNKNNKNLVYANFLLSKYEFNQKNYEKEFQYLLNGHNSFLQSENKAYKNDINYFIIKKMIFSKL